MEPRHLGVQTLRAALCEIERGLFQVSYHSDSAGAGGPEWVLRTLPTYQTGTCASDAKQRIEERAQGCGFEMVNWDDVGVFPALLLGSADEVAAATTAIPDSTSKPPPEPNATVHRASSDAGGQVLG